MKLKKLAAAAAMAGATLGLFGTAHAAIVADVVFVIDTSGSMGDDIAQVRNRILQFDTTLGGAGIDAQYGLVRFGGVATLVQDLTSFANFTQAGSPFSTLSANGGGTEDGSAALQVALTASYRANAVRNIILITDENDDVASNRPALTTALAGTSANELINIIGNPNDDAGNYYRNLAPANGGAFFNILNFRNDPAPFFANFTATKLNEIVQDFCTRFPTDPSCVNQPPTGQIPEPGSLALMGAAVAAMVGVRTTRRRRDAVRQPCNEA